MQRGYELGQKLMQGILRFTAPLDIFVARLLPFYFVLFSIFSFVGIKFLDFDWLHETYQFIGGILLGMHVILTAQDLQEEEKSIVKPNYIFLMTIILTFNLFLAIFAFDLVLGEFTIDGYLQGVVDKVSVIYMGIFSRFTSA